MKSVYVLVLLLAGCTSESPPVVPMTLVFSVEGMHCEACVEAITAAVEQVEGVTDCAVSLEEKRAVVLVEDPTLGSTVLEMIRSLQFTAQPIAEQ